MLRLSALAVLFLSACGANPHPVGRPERHPMQRVTLRIQGPQHYGVRFAADAQAFTAQVSLLYRPSVWLNPPGRSSLRPVDGHSIQQAAWTTILEESMVVDLDRLLLVGRVGISLSDPRTGRMMIRLCPPDLLQAYVEGEDGSVGPQPLSVILLQFQDPEYGCLYRLTAP